MSDYQVDLEVFRGPLDLLLYLVKREEVDIRDIPIACVAEQFKDYLNVLTLLDVEWIGDFLVMAATLMEIKSKMLLPRSDPLSEEEEDPRAELVRQLILYKRFKEATAHLDAQADEQSRRLARIPGALERPAAEKKLRPIELWDLVSAFGRLMRETLAIQPQQIVVDQTPLHVYTQMILDRLRTEGRLPLSAFFTPPCTRPRLVGLFLAILELTRHRQLLAEQDEPFADIWVCLSETESQESGVRSQGSGVRGQG
jgi:segregation and condensation protein A